MEINEFIGIWKNESGNILEIYGNNKNELKVNFISGMTGKPVIRKYFDNMESIDMKATLDFYESSLEVELWPQESGFQLVLLYDWINFRNDESEYCLAPGLSENFDSDLVQKYGHLFEPLGYYKRVKTGDNSR